jgi:hypothetical protein
MIYKYSQISDTQIVSYEQAKKLCKISLPHLGQLKLFFTELFFLTKCAEPGDKVVYAGAAQGYHIPLLADMFPDITFDLWDPARFDFHPRKTIKAFNKFFTNETAKQYSKDGNKILFIVDIRTIENINEIKENTKEFDILIDKDMEMQKKWCQIMKPRYIFYKFRLPYEYEKYNYITGEIMLQPYSPFSTESRLLTNDYFTEIEYDCKLYDEKLAYHNVYDRCVIGKFHKFEKIMEQLNLINNWDNAMGLAIIHFYLKKIKNDKSKESIGKIFMDIIDFHIKKYGYKKYSIIFKSKQKPPDTK